MISVTSVTGNYILQPELLDKHAKTLEWLSTTVIWKSELKAFQRILEEKVHLMNTVEEKKKCDHFQNLIIYYDGELIGNLRMKLRDHEIRLANTLETKNEADSTYFNEHGELMEELTTFSEQFKSFRNEFVQFLNELTEHL